MRRANYRVVQEDDEVILLEDIGPWDKYLSITNGAEEVVAELAGRLRGRHLLYYDSGSELTELLYADGEFTGFGTCPDRIMARLGMRGSHND